MYNKKCFQPRKAGGQSVVRRQNSVTIDFTPVWARDLGGGQTARVESQSCINLPWEKHKQTNISEDLYQPSVSQVVPLSHSHFATFRNKPERLYLYIYTLFSSPDIQDLTVTPQKLYTPAKFLLEQLIKLF